MLAEKNERRRATTMRGKRLVIPVAPKQLTVTRP